MAFKLKRTTTGTTYTADSRDREPRESWDGGKYKLTRVRKAEYRPEPAAAPTPDYQPPAPPVWKGSDRQFAADRAKYDLDMMKYEGNRRDVASQQRIADEAKRKADLAARSKAVDSLVQNIAVEPKPEGYRDPTVKDLLWNSAKQGYYNSLYGKEAFRNMMGKENRKGEYEKILEGEDYKFYPQTPLERALSGGAALLGQQVSQFGDPTTVGAALAAGGAASVAGKLGPQALLPEEILTVPAAAALGMQAGSAQANLKIEAGLAYEEMLDNGVTPETAKAVALGVGGFNAALEMVQADELLKSFKVLRKNPATKGMADGVKDELLRRGADIASETAQEVAQEGVTIAGTQLAKKKDTGDWAYNKEEVLSRLADTGISSALSFGVLNAPGAISGIRSANRDPLRAAAMDVVREKQAEQDREIANAVRERAEAQEKADVRPVERTERMERVITPPERSEAVRGLYGENGTKAMNDLRTPGGSEADYMGGFSAYYHAGLTGQKQSEVRPMFQQMLTPEQRNGAFLVGQKDAKESLAREKAAAAFAPSAGTESGLVLDDYTRDVMDSEVARRINGMAKRLGVRVRMADEVNGGLANAQITGDEILLNKNTQEPELFVMGHEFTHRVQQLAPQEYHTFRDAIGREEGFQQTVERIQTFYQSRGVNIDYQQAMDEATANYAGRLMQDGEVMDRFIEHNRNDRTLLQRVLDAVKELIGKLTGKEKQAAETNRDKLDAALNAAAKQEEKNRRKAGSFVSSYNAAEFSDAETRYSLREGDPPKETGVAYKVFLAKDGQLYPPMVANPGGAGTPVGVWLDADVGKSAPPSKTGRPQVQGGGKGTNSGKISLSFRPGWHLGDIPLAKQFAKKNPETGEKDLFPENFVWAKCEYAKDVDYQEEAMSYGYTDKGKFRHSYAGLPKLPKDGYYRYRTNPNPDTVPWVITGAMKVTDILSDEQVDKICRDAGVEPMKRMGGPIDLEKFGLTAGPVTESEKKFSLAGSESLDTDSTGKKLTADQQKFFKDSKIRDESGNLVPMYHGTLHGGFTVFGGKKDYAYFTNDRKYAYTFEGRKANGNLYPSVKQDMEKGYVEPQRYKVYLNVKNPFIAEADVVEDALYWDKTLAQSLRDKGYDALMTKDMSQVITLYPEQVKNTTNKHPTADPDIRFSLTGSENLDSAAELRAENERLRKRVEYWKGQTKKTPMGAVDQKAVDRVAKELVDDYSASVKPKEIAGELKRLYDYIGTGKDGQDELTYTEASRRAREIARTIVDSAVEVDDQMYREYKGLREELRARPLVISEEESHDIPDFGDFRKRNMGRLDIRKGNTNVDTVYEELASAHPELFDASKYTSPADQLEHIASVMDDMYRVTEYNPYSGDEEIMGRVVNDIMDRFFDTPNARPTFADRAETREQNAKQRGRELVQAEREKRERMLRELKLKQKQQREKGVKSRNAKELRDRIKHHVKDLSAKLTGPTDKKHIPDPLRKPVADLLNAINLESTYEIDFDEQGNQKRVKAGSGATPTKRTAEFRRVREAYQKILAADDGTANDMDMDVDLMENLDRITAGDFADKRLGDMSLEELDLVWRTVKGIESSISSLNKDMAIARGMKLKEVTEEIRDENIAAKDRGDYKGFAGDLRNLATVKMLTPQQFFHQIGEMGTNIFKALRNAQDRKTTILDEMQAATHEIVGKQKVAELEKEVHTVSVGGQTFEMSTAEIMNLYLLSRREQAMQHLLNGGLRPDAVQKKWDIRLKRPTSSIRVSKWDIDHIISQLTPEQMEIARDLQRLISTRMAEYGNEASREMYGYSKFGEKDYWPIKADEHQTETKAREGDNTKTIASMGSGKALNPNATNGLVVGSVFDVASENINDMTNYAAWLVPLAELQKIYNYTFRDETGRRDGNVKDIVERLFGMSGNQYMKNLLDDLNAGVQDGDKALTERMVGKFKATAVGANIRVFLQQPSAILRAAAMIDPKYMVQGAAVHKGDWAKVKKYSPIAVWKDWGYFDAHTGRSVKDILFDSASKMEKLNQAAMAPAGMMDSLAWTQLWNAVEAETRDKRKNLTPGTESFYQAVAERFNDIVDQTQVVDGVLQRSDVMRSGNAITKMATSFMSEPTKTYNMFLGAVKDAGEDKAKRKQLARTSAALVISFAANAVAQSIVDAMRDDDKEKDYWEKFLESYKENFSENFNPLGYIPFVKDVWSMTQGYDVSRTDMDVISKFIRAAQNALKAYTGDGRFSKTGATMNLIVEGSRFFGMPLANLKRDIQAALSTVALETDNYLMQYYIDRSLYNPAAAGNTGRFVDTLYSAYQNDRAAYDLIYRKLIKSGMPEKSIRSGMEKRMKEAQGVESTADLKQRWLPPESQARYDAARKRLASTPVWEKAGTEAREKAETNLYNVTVGNGYGERITDKAKAGERYGLTETDIILYNLALDVADSRNRDPEKRNGSYDGKEKDEALRMMRGLSRAGKDYLRG